MNASFGDFLKKLFDLHDGKEQEEKVVEGIKKNVEFAGANLWSLIFAVFIASIGLNINSTAVVIGAMLISPLMGPIVGIGLSLGIHDFSLLRRSLKNISIATFLSIVISAMYFYLSPINGAQSELLARINPTIYDVLIAFFGGLVGVVGATRSEKSTVIPGVAIATALIPPLCTAGFGVATGQASFFFGALYLYSINALFICLGTLVVVKYLRLPQVRFFDENTARRVRRTITALVAVIVLPAGYFAYGFVSETNFKQNANRYINEVFEQKGYTIVYRKADYRAHPRKIELAFLFQRATPEELRDARARLADYHLDGTELSVQQDTFSFDEKDLNALLGNIRDEKEKVKILEAKFSSGALLQDSVSSLFFEARAINPKIAKIALGTVSVFGAGHSASSTKESIVPVVLAYMNDSVDPASATPDAQEKETLSKWLTLRLKNEHALVLFPSASSAPAVLFDEKR